MLATISKTSLPILRLDLPRVVHHWRPAHHEILLVEFRDTNERIVPIVGMLPRHICQCYHGSGIVSLLLQISRRNSLCNRIASLYWQVLCCTCL